MDHTAAMDALTLTKVHAMQKIEPILGTETLHTLKHPLPDRQNKFGGKMEKDKAATFCATAGERGGW